MDFSRSQFDEIEYFENCNIPMPCEHCGNLLHVGLSHTRVICNKCRHENTINANVRNKYRKERLKDINRDIAGKIFILCMLVATMLNVIYCFTVDPEKPLRKEYTIISMIAVPIMAIMQFGLFYEKKFKQRRKLKRLRIAENVDEFPVNVENEIPTFEDFDDVKEYIKYTDKMDPDVVCVTCKGCGRDLWTRMPKEKVRCYACWKDNVVSREDKELWKELQIYENNYNFKSDSILMIAVMAVFLILVIVFDCVQKNPFPMFNVMLQWGICFTWFAISFITAYFRNKKANEGLEKAYTSSL